ncbi:Uma2 family endonuclease [Microseira sp. BLCC-F43]|jgi:Uma2 family endonuclease|uniref:Uma2 family endonuclease n=1 Tax=Microseira sp. BLCC-F43 TaxID=3153602 RepID=UPI0035B80054
MTTFQAKQKLTFEQFLELEVEAEGFYELVNGEVVRKLATRQHDNIADFLVRQLDRENERASLNYRVSGRVVVRTLTPDGQEQGRQPDVSVVDQALWDSNLSAYTAFVEPLQLAIEVVSTNWEDDYIDKLDEYQRLGIPEYWIVDYLALGSRNYLGNPKVPTVFVLLLDENGIYQCNPYRGAERIISRTFPELALTSEQIIQA